MDHDSGAEGCPGFVTALVLRCGQGDRAALLALMDLLYAPVRARLAPTCADEEADALVGRAFVHLWHRASSYAPRSQPDVVAWLLDEAVSGVGSAAPVLVAS